MAGPAGVVRGACVAALIALAAPAWAARVPECGPLTTWAVQLDLNDRWQLNRLGPSRHTLPRLLGAPETAALFGSPALDWTEAETAAIVAAIRDCGAQAQRERRGAERIALNRAGSVLSGLLPQYHQALSRARAEAGRAAEALSAQPPTLAGLRFEAAIAATGESPSALQVATSAIGAMPAAAQAPARSLVEALRDMPEAELRDVVGPAAARRAAASRGAVRDHLVAGLAAIPASPQGLAQLGQTQAAIGGEFARLFPARDLAVLERAVAMRRETVEAGVAEAVLQRIAAVPAELATFRVLDDAMRPELLRLLRPEVSTRLTDAAAARRAAVAAAVEAGLRGRLAALPETDAGLRELDQGPAAEIEALPASAAAEAARLRTLVAARRGAILAAVERAEAGPLRGRRYDDAAGARLRFLDRGRVELALPDGRTLSGSYAEQGAARVSLTIEQQTLELRREGARLVGPMMSWQRAAP